jgi:hypothetical protein
VTGFASGLQTGVWEAQNGANDQENLSLIQGQAKLSADWRIVIYMNGLTLDAPRAFR